MSRISSAEPGEPICHHWISTGTSSNRLFTRFSLSTPTGQHVRIRSVQLQSSKEDDDSLTITQSVSRSMSVTVSATPSRIYLRIELKFFKTITPTQTGHWLFQLDSTRGKG